MNWLSLETCPIQSNARAKWAKGEIETNGLTILNAWARVRPAKACARVNWEEQKAAAEIAP